jgi:hypothetical protein
LVWELKENWRLYAANRAPKLLPVHVGRHAETVGRLLRPGFHSGTVGKLFGRLRRARRKVKPGGNWTAVFKCEAGLEEVRESMRQFVERELLALLRLSKASGIEQVGVGRVALSTNSIHIELKHEAAPRDSAWLRFEEQSGWLLGSLRPAGWLAHLPDEDRYHWYAALTGLYKMAGVDLLREQIEAQLAGWAETYNFFDEGLLVWPRGSGWQPALYPLVDDPELRAESPDGSEREGLPTLERAAVVFSDQPLSWAAWVTTWQRSPGAWTTAAERPTWWRTTSYNGVQGISPPVPVRPLGHVR